jgi:hypothetical protein
VGSDRDYDSKPSGEKSGSKHADRSRMMQDRMNAIRALDKAGRMTKEAASRIQSHSDRTGKNEDFKERAMSAADRNED